MQGDYAGLRANFVPTRKNMPVAELFEHQGFALAGIGEAGEKRYHLAREQAAQWGLIWRCVPDEEFPAAVDELAHRLAAAPTRALARTKEALYGSGARSLAERDEVLQSTTEWLWDVIADPVLTALSAHEIARREHADAGDLQIGRKHTTTVDGG